MPANIMFKLVLAWEAEKEWLAHSLHLTHWTLHVIVGVTSFLLTARLMRRPVGSFIPLLPVAILEAINEAFDFTRYHVSGWPWTPWFPLIETALTLVPPALIAVGAGAMINGARLPYLTANRAAKAVPPVHRETAEPS